MFEEVINIHKFFKNQRQNISIKILSDTQYINIFDLQQKYGGEYHKYLLSDVSSITLLNLCDQALVIKNKFPMFIEFISPLITMNKLNDNITDLLMTI